MLELIHVSNENSASWTVMPWVSFSGFTFDGRTEANTIGLRHVFYEGKQRRKEFFHPNEYLHDPDTNPTMDKVLWSKWGLKRSYNDVENFQYHGKVYNLSYSGNEWMKCSFKDLVTLDEYPSVSITPWGDSQHLHATIPYSTNIWTHQPGNVQFDSQFIRLRTRKQRLDTPDVDCTFNVYAHVYYTVSPQYWAKSREEMLQWNEANPDGGSCLVDRELSESGYYDTVYVRYHTYVIMTHDHPEYWRSPLSWYSVKCGGTLLEIPYAYNREDMEYFRVDAGGVGSMQMWVNTHIGKVESFWDTYADSNYRVGGLPGFLDMHDMHTLPGFYIPDLPTSDALFPKKDRNPNWGTMAAEAYASVPLQPTNGLDYLRDAAELGPQIAKFAKTLRSLPLRQAQGAAKIYLAEHYGLENALRDTADYIHHFRNGRNVRKLIKRCASLQQIHSSSGFMTTARYQTLYDSTGEVFDYAQGFLESLGVTPNMQNIWDLVPYSFVVDWFTNLGDFFKAVDGMFNACSRYNSVVSIKSIKSLRTLSTKDLSVFNPSLESVLKDTFEGERTKNRNDIVTSGLTAEFYSRRCSYYPQVPLLSDTHVPALLQHSVEAGALIVQRL